MEFVKENVGVMLDFFVRDVFDNVASDEFLFELFCKYFSDEILHRSFFASKLYLSDEEKTLQYSGKNTVEPLFEYTLLIKNQESRHRKRYYAEKAANFSIVHPIIHPELGSNKDFYISSASNFYSTVSANSDFSEVSDFFDFLASLTGDMVYGLEKIIDNIKQDGTLSLNKIYQSLILDYSMELEESRKESLAKK